MPNNGASSELVGLAEVAELLSVSKQRVFQLRERRDFPDPMAELSSGPVWDRATITRWQAARRTDPGRPRREDVRGDLLGERFELGELIGAGGFADVYRALDLDPDNKDADQIVAVKILREEFEEARGRFQRELRILEGLSHPNVIPVLASGELDGRPWYAMPLAKGNLFDELRVVGAQAPVIVDTMRQICRGLEYLHDKGIFHRDLTPMNVLRTKSGAWAISDFGLAREAERRTATLTTTNTNLGVFYYQAPELLMEFRAATVQSDMYSLGKTLHALVLGRHPFPGRDDPDGVFRTIIRRATMPEPEQRYQTVREFVADVEAIASVPAVWESPGQALDRLADELQQREMEVELLDELLLVGGGPEEPPLPELARAMAHLSSREIEHLWRKDPAGFRGMFQRFGEALRGSFQFEFCDALAEFAKRAVSATQDDDVVRVAAFGLARLGEYHNRWHVRSVLVSILQDIRSSAQAMAALDGLRQAGRSPTEWNLQEFVIRSLHPVLRDGVTAFLASGDN